MTYYTSVPTSRWIKGAVYETETRILNLFFESSSDLGRAKRAMGTFAEEVEGPQPWTAHEVYHGQLADELSSAGADEDTVKSARAAKAQHGHFELPDFWLTRRKALAELGKAGGMSTADLKIFVPLVAPK